MVERTGPVSAWGAMDLDSPVLAEFLRDGRASAAGVPVNELGALRNSTFFRATNLICSSIGMLPTFLMRRKTDKAGVETIEKAKDHPLYRVLHKRPNAYQTAFEFKSYMQLLALLDGNAYALIVRGVRERVERLVPLKRHSVTPKLSNDGQVTFEYRRTAARRARVALRHGVPK